MATRLYLLLLFMICLRRLLKVKKECKADSINYLVESHAVPFDCVLEAIKVMAYGTAERVMFELLALTGMRLSELDNCLTEKFFPQKDHTAVLYWHLGKNQREHRHVKLPEWWFTEYCVYRDNNRVPRTSLFGICNRSFRRRFNRFVRPKLSDAWHEKMPHPHVKGVDYEYALQLKGLRKSYQTKLFAENLKKWGQADVALVFTSKEMRHSSTGMTAYYYLENFERVGVDKYLGMSMDKILSIKDGQKRLLDFDSKKSG